MEKYEVVFQAYFDTEDVSYYTFSLEQLMNDNSIDSIGKKVPVKTAIEYLKTCISEDFLPQATERKEELLTLHKEKCDRLDLSTDECFYPLEVRHLSDKITDAIKELNSIDSLIQYKYAFAVNMDRGFIFTDNKMTVYNRNRSRKRI